MTCAQLLRVHELQNMRALPRGFHFLPPLLLLALFYLLRNQIPTHPSADNEWDGRRPLDGEATLQGSIVADADIKPKSKVDWSAVPLRTALPAGTSMRLIL